MINNKKFELNIESGIAPDGCTVRIQYDSAMEYGSLRYDSMQIWPPPRFLSWISDVFNLDWFDSRHYALGPSYSELARRVTVYGVEPGLRAVQTTVNGGRGLDFYSLDPESDPAKLAMRWLTTTPEPVSQE